MTQAIPSPFPDLDFFRSALEEIPLSRRRVTSVSNLKVSAIQSHYDDFALSASGTVLRVASNLNLFTTHAQSAQEEQRRLEDANIDLLISTKHHDASNPERSGDFVTPETWMPTDLVIGPAGVGRNPDHLATSQFAERSGALMFWEDVAFWGIYAQSVDDRLLFSLMRRDWLNDKLLFALSIDIAASMKAWLLSNYPTQSNDVWRVMRYAWSAAREIDAAATFVERFFVPRDQANHVSHLLGLRLETRGEVRYGTFGIETFEGIWE